MAIKRSMFRIFCVLLITLFLLAATQSPQNSVVAAPDTSDRLSVHDQDGAQMLLPTSPETTASNLAQHAYLKSSNTEATDNFGSVLSLSGDTLVVGAPNEDSNATGVNGNQADNSASDSGAAYVFIRNGDEWSQQAYLKASNSSSNDHFGSAVSISGDTLVVGAGGLDAAYVFTRTGTTWTQQAYLQPSNPAYFRDDRFGEAVSISGDTLVVGASGEDSAATGVNGNQLSNTTSESGATYVFTRTAGVWTQQAYLKASNTEVNDYFGSVVFIEGETVVVGAYGEDSGSSGINGDQADNSKLDSGAAYVFTRTGAAWSQQAYLKASNPDESDRFARALSLSGETLAVGAPYESSSSSIVNGNQNDNSGYTSGAVYVFTRTANVWSQQEYIKPSNTGIADQFGSALSLAGDVLIVGAPFEDSSSTGVNGSQVDLMMGVFPILESGAAYIFVRSDTTWEQQTYLKASNTGANDRFGSAVSSSGGLFVVGAPLEDSHVTGVNGDQTDNTADDSGAAYVLGVAPPATPRTDYNWSQMTADSPNKSRVLDFKLDRDGAPHMVLGGDYLYYATLNDGTWNIEAVDHTRGAGRVSVSLAFDTNNQPHIAYRGSSVYHAYWNGAEWVIQSVPNSAMDGYVAMALDSLDHPHIVFTDSSASRGLRYASWTGTKWIVQQIDTCSSSAPSLAIDPNNVPHVSYDCGELRHATWAGASWHIDSIPTPISASGTTSIALDSNGWPHIAYNPISGGSVGYIAWNGTAWGAPETVDGAADQGTSLVIDHLDVPHISYSGSGRVLNEATFNGSTWDIQTVPVASKICYRTALAVDANGNRHVGYIACLPENFYYTHETSPGTWSTPQLIVTSTSVGPVTTSMTVDRNDHPHLSTGDWYQGTLRYSTWDGTQWLNQVVDDVGVGNEHIYTSIKTDSNNRPHIAYFGIGGLLKYASWDGTQWQIESLGLTGGYPSLALDQNTDDPRIAFCSNGLKYASWDGATWTIQTVDTICGEPDFGAENTLILDTQGNPHISYFNGYAYWDHENSQWVKDASAPPANVSSLALDSTGAPHVAACASSGLNHQAPIFSSWDGSTWKSTTIDDPFPSQNTVCLTTSLTIDDHDIPYVSYVEPFGDTLRLVIWSDAVWSSQIVATSATGLYTPISAGTQNDLWIAYIDLFTGDLMMAHGVPIPPMVSSVRRTDANPTAAASVHFTVKFSKPVTGVDVNDFVPVTSGIANASILNVTGSGSEYTVTVATGVHNGTLRLDVTDDNTIIDRGGDPLGGAGLDDGDFSTGEVYDVIHTVTISGYAGSPGVTLTYMVNGVTKTVISDNKGRYVLVVPEGWSGTVTPSRYCGGYRSFTRCYFLPAKKIYARVTSNLTRQNYVLKIVP